MEEGCGLSALVYHIYSQLSAKLKVVSPTRNLRMPHAVVTSDLPNMENVWT
jgi:hypothetical protein